MKRIILILALAFISVGVKAQIKELSNAFLIHNPKEWVEAANNFGQWARLDYGRNKGMYIMYFDETTVGFMHEVNKVKEICDNYGVDFNNPVSDKSLIPSYAKNINDYSAMHTGLIAGDGEINKNYVIKTKNGSYFLVFSASKKLYSITIIKIPIS